MWMILLTQKGKNSYAVLLLVVSLKPGFLVQRGQGGLPKMTSP